MDIKENITRKKEEKKEEVKEKKIFSLTMEVIEQPETEDAEKENSKADYEQTVAFDRMIGEMQPNTAIRSKIYISRSRKRIEDLLPEECNDAEYFDYNGKAVWNGF